MEWPASKETIIDNNTAINFQYLLSHPAPTEHLYIFFLTYYFPIVAFVPDHNPAALNPATTP